MSDELKQKTYKLEFTEQQLHYIQWALYEYDLSAKGKQLDPSSNIYKELNEKIEKQIGLKARGSINNP